jgi:hypothetical protein
VSLQAFPRCPILSAILDCTGPRWPLAGQAGCNLIIDLADLAAPQLL